MRGDRPNRPETVFAGSGAIDLGARRGRMELDLAGLLPGEPPPGETNPFADPIELRWDADTLYGELDGRAGSLDRARARESGGLMGDAPDEPEGLVELLSQGRQARRIDGEGGRRFEFVVDMRTAAVHGAPFELEAEAARRLLGPRLTMTATLDDDGRPAEISYRYRLEPVRHPDTNRLVLPTRTVTVTYRLSEFGEQVDVGPPER